MSLRLILSVIFLSLLPLRILSQIDTEFWFAAPDITDEYGQAPKNGAPISLHFTALYATTVTVSRPADPAFIPIQLTLQDLESKSIELSAILPLNQIETYPRALTDPTAYQDKGFKITAYPGEISCYYELNNKHNKDIFPLKGTNGLGKEFYVSTQNTFINGDYKGTAWSGFVIVATENNTTVNIELNDDILHFIPYPATVTITLNEGQTYAFRSLSTQPDRHINGVRVTSNNNIAVTVYDDAMQKERVVGGTSWDLFGDQIVPLDIVGTEYIVMKGFMVDAPEDGGERIFVTATQDNTMIYIDNNPVPVATINRGKVFTYAIMNQTTLVTTSAPVYINHITGFEADLGGAILPPIGNCSGSYDVAFNRSPDPSESFYLNIMVRNVTTSGDPMRNQAAKNFSITSNGVITPIPEAYFTYILDSTYAVLKRDPVVIAFITSCIEPGWAAMVRNPVTKFHLGIINGHINTGCKYGYFSDYKVINTSAGIGGALSNTREAYCDLDPIRLVARGGMRYKWTCTSDPSVTALISNTNISDPFFQPVTSGNYMFNVRITQDCGPEVNLPLQVIVMYRPVADFDLSDDEGCSPFTATITHHVDMSRVGKMYWYFDYPNSNPSASQDTLSNSFQWKFPENNTDSIIPFKIRLYTWAPFNACPDYMDKTVLVKPGVRANFAVDDSSGCHPLPVSFNNLSTGNLTDQSYHWDFGDNMQSYDSLPEHIYINYNNTTVTYPAKLVVTSPFECKDSITKNIEVFPYIRGSLLVDSTGRCSPIIAHLDPHNSIGVDTFFYTIRSPEYNGQFKRISNESIAINYSDTSYINGPDTISTNLIVQNRMGCSDTVIAKDIIVYPEVRTKFDIDPPEICDASSTQIINQSFGQDVAYIWDFGDGSSSFDSIPKNFAHTYYNLGETPAFYILGLEGMNEYLCYSSYDTLITVYPRVNAFFTIENTNNCSPLDVKISNFSHRVTNYTWNFGDGTPLDHSNDPFLFHQYFNSLPDRDTSYTLALNVISPEGCIDSMKRNITILPQVLADFAMSDSAGCSPSTITFDNNSTGNNLVFNWQFGDILKTNNTSWFAETFTNFEADDSTFTVQLTASNPQGCESSLSRQFTIYPFVSAIFGVDNLAGCAPLNVNTINFSSPGATYYDWDFGDGHISNEYEPSNLYENSSTDQEVKSLRLIVKNEHACYDTATVMISVFPALHTDFQVDRIKGCQPLNVEFANNSNIKPNTSFLWNFDNGRYSNMESPPAQLFNNLSNTSTFFNVHLQGTTQYGCYDDTTLSIEVYPYIFAKFTIDRPGICSDELFNIDRNGSSGAINHYFWDYDDNGTNEEDKPLAKFTHTYSNTGDFDFNRAIRLTVTNQQGCDTSWTETIVVHPQVRASFSVDADQVCHPAAMTFTNASEPAIPLNYYWNMGDGSATTNANPVYAYRNFSHTNDETFVVELTATSSYGCDSTVSKSITIHPKPLADFNFPLAVSCPPFSVPFTNNSQGTNLNYTWDLGNRISDEFAPVEVFDNTGTSIVNNTISLKTETSFGCSDTTKKQLSVFPGVKVDFDASEWAGCNPMEIDLNGTATNENEYSWYVDGVNISNYEDLSYRFVNETTTDKVFRVRFKAVSINGCSADTLKEIKIYPKPIAEFLPYPQAQAFNTATDITAVTFNNLTNNQPIWNYKWDFGDGTHSAQSNASLIKNYTLWGNINNNSRIPVSLIATNANHAVCADTVMHFVIIYPPAPVVDLGPDVTGCMPLTVQFPSSTKYNYADKYTWDFGVDGQQSSSTYPDPIVYDTAGTYIVRLTVLGDGGTSWDYKLIHVYPEPVVAFEFSPDYAWIRSQTEDGEPIKFFNTTDAAISYFWEFGDGSESNEFQPQHEYTMPNEYYVTLTAENGNGCESSLTKGPIIIDGHGFLQFPNAIAIQTGNPGNEYYNPDNATDRRIFRPLNKGIAKYKLEIYNRWGELIFESDDVNRGWNGYIDGKPVKQDVYVWRVTVTFTNGKPFVGAGDVTVLVQP